MQLTDGPADLVYAPDPPDAGVWIPADVRAQEFFSQSTAFSTKRAFFVHGAPTLFGPCAPSAPIGADLVASAFHLLVRWDEHCVSSRDRFGRLPFDASTFGQVAGLDPLDPPVERYIGLIADALRHRPAGWLAGLPDQRHRRPADAHAADPDQTGQDRPTRSPRAGHRPLVGTDPWNNVGDLLWSMSRRGLASTVFLIGSHTDPHDGSPARTYAAQRARIARAVRGAGGEVALHTSFGGADSRDAFAAELAAFDAEVGAADPRRPCALPAVPLPRDAGLDRGRGARVRGFVGLAGAPGFRLRDRPPVRTVDPRGRAPGADRAGARWRCPTGTCGPPRASTPRRAWRPPSGRPRSFGATAGRRRFSGTTAPWPIHGHPVTARSGRTSWIRLSPTAHVWADPAPRDAGRRGPQRSAHPAPDQRPPARATSGSCTSTPTPPRVQARRPRSWACGSRPDGPRGSCAGWRLVGRARREGADIYHVHDPELLPAALWLRMPSRTPVVYDVHEYLGETVRTKLWLPAPVRRPLAVVVSRLERSAGGTTATPWSASTRTSRPVSHSPVPPGSARSPTRRGATTSLFRSRATIRSCSTSVASRRCAGSTSCGPQRACSAPPARASSSPGPASPARCPLSVTYLGVVDHSEVPGPLGARRGRLDPAPGARQLRARGADEARRGHGGRPPVVASDFGRMAAIVRQSRMRDPGSRRRSGRTRGGHRPALWRSGRSPNAWAPPGGARLTPGSRSKRRPTA